MIKSKLTRDGYVIEKSNLTEAKINKLKVDLNVKADTGDYGDAIPFDLYTETKSTIIVPRFYGIEKFGQPQKNELTNNKVDFKFTAKLRENQIPIVDACMKGITENGGGLLSVGCGVGKTIMSLKIAADLGLKTLVLVHKTFLQDQWIERIKSVTNAKYGIIRQNKADVRGKDIVIGMAQSISSRDYEPEVFEKFDFVILDEAHHYPSRVFSRCLQKVGAKHLLALSATPERSDGLTKVLHWYVGGLLFKQETKPNKHVAAKIFEYKSDDPLFAEKTMWCKGKISASNTKMTNNLVNIQSRNDCIMNIINTLRKDPKRKILILSGRVDHLTYMKTSLDASIKKDIDEGKLLENECRTFYYKGKIKAKDRRDAEVYGDIIFGTYEMAHEGLDIERLNTIILATPKKNVIQAIGRIMRRVLQAGDIKPLIIDIADQLSIYVKQGETRAKEYKKNKYKIQRYYIEDNILGCDSDVKKSVTSYENALSIDFVTDDKESESSDDEPLPLDYSEYLF